MSLVLIKTMDEYDSYVHSLVKGRNIDAKSCPVPEYLPCLAASAFVPGADRLMTCFVYADAALRLVSAAEQLARDHVVDGEPVAADGQSAAAVCPTVDGFDPGVDESFAAAYKPTPTENEWRMQIMAVLVAIMEECAAVGVVRLDKMPSLVAAKLAAIDQDISQRDHDLAAGLLSIVARPTPKTSPVTGTDT